MKTAAETGWRVIGAFEKIVLLLALPAFALSLSTQKPPEKSTVKAGAPSDGGTTDFIRFVPGRKGEGKLETAIVTYRREDGATVDLIAAVHVGDRAYYRNLQKRFETYEALLYEMIKPQDAEPVPGARPDNLLSVFQRGLKDALALEFQLDALDYRKANFVHADVDPATFFRLQREKGESFLSLLFKFMRKEMAREAQGRGSQMGLFELIQAFASDDSARSLKLLLARQMEDVEAMMAGFEEGDEKGGSVIVAERNKVAIGALERVLREGKKRTAIFYGAGHMQDFEKRLRDLGFAKDGGEWVTAWNIAKRER